MSTQQEQAPRDATSEPWWSRLGVPPLARSGRFASATAIDSIGTGLMLAFTVVYFAMTTSVSLVTIGFAISLARLLALPTSLAIGPLIDRFTSRRVAVAGNLISAGAFLSFPLTETAWSIVVVMFLVQIGHTTYWTSSAGLVALAAPAGRRTRWFGFIHALRNAGIGIGSAGGALLLSINDVNGLYAIVVLNAVSFVVAALLLWLWRPVPHSESDHAPPQPSEQLQQDLASKPLPEHDSDASKQSPSGAARTSDGYAVVLRDRAYTLLIGINVTEVLAQMLIKILLAIYILEALRMDAWIAGALVVVSTVQVALTQTVTTRQLERFRATRVIIAGCLFNAVSFALFAALYGAPAWMLVGGLFAAMIVFTFGEIIGIPAIENLSVSLPPERIRGRYLGVYQLSWSIGEIVAPTVLIWLLDVGAILPMIFLVVTSFIAIPMVLVLERMLMVRRNAA